MVANSSISSHPRARKAFAQSLKRTFKFTDTRVTDEAPQHDDSGATVRSGTVADAHG